MESQLETRSCSELGRQLVLVKKPDGSVLKFVFSAELGAFESVTCSDCPAAPTDADLSPKLVGWCPHTEKTILVAFNNATQNLGVYHFEPRACRIIEIECDDCKLGGNLDLRETAPTQIMMVAGSHKTKNSMVLLMTTDGRLRKCEFDDAKDGYMNMEPSEIEMLKKKEEQEESAAAKDLRLRAEVWAKAKADFDRKWEFIAKHTRAEEEKRAAAAAALLPAQGIDEYVAHPMDPKTWSNALNVRSKVREEIKKTGLREGWCRVPMGPGRRDMLVPPVTMDNRLLPMYNKRSEALAAKQVMVAFSEVTGEIGKYVFDRHAHQFMQVECELADEKIAYNHRRVAFISTSLGEPRQVVAAKCDEKTGHLLKWTCFDGARTDFKMIAPMKVITKETEVDEIIAKFKESYDRTNPSHVESMEFYKAVKKVMIVKKERKDGENSDDDEDDDDDDKEFDFLDDTKDLE